MKNIEVYPFCLLIIWLVGLSFVRLPPRPDVPNGCWKSDNHIRSTKGTAGLKDCNCDVYIHIGAVTESAPASYDLVNLSHTWATTDQRQKDPRVDGADKS